MSYCPQCSAYEKEIAALEKEKAEAVLAERERCARIAERCDGDAHIRGNVINCVECGCAIREGRE